MKVRCPRPASWSVLAAALALAPTAGRAATGSDLAAGYTWRDSGDGAVAEPATFDGTTTTFSPPDDSPPVAVSLPWDFPFYGASRTTAYVSDNGWISFVNPGPSSHPSPAPMPSAAAPHAVIAPYWGQLFSEPITFGLRITHGPITSANAYMFEVIASEASSGNMIGWRLILYRTGAVKIMYVLAAVPWGTATVGIENEAGTDGCAVTALGTPSPGVPGFLPTDYVVDFIPPPILPPQCASIPLLACPAALSESLPGTLALPVDEWSCSGAAWNARERIHSFTLGQPSRVTASVTPGSATNLALFLLDACSERSCIGGGAASLSAALMPGTYYLVVDAPSTGDEGSYQLSLGCQPLGGPITCGTTVSGTTAGGPTLADVYPCARAADLSGPEAYHVLDLAASTNVRATLSGAAAGLDVLLLSPDGSQVVPEDCAAHGDVVAVAWSAQPGTYLVVVDGDAASAGAYTLTLDCVIEVDCSAPDGQVDFSAGRIQTIAGTTLGGIDRVQTYSCDTGTMHDGPEAVYEVVLPQPGQLVAIQTSGAPGLSFFVLSECNEGACLGGTDSQGCGSPMPAGTYYLVVDGAAGAAGDFEVLLAYEESFNPWTSCERPSGLTQPTDTVSNFWGFDDGAYCYTEPGSINYPLGCVFAMYMVVQCGTAMHLPLYDVESGHVRIFDVFRGEYLDLTAESTGGWSMVGTDIAWYATDCQLGDDVFWNDQVTDVFFERAEGLCGVFRIEFVNHSGFVWELYSNCDGARSGQFNIHSTLCGALSEYDPLPSLSIVSATAVASCPDVTITYEVRNDGCGLARDVPVQLYDGLVLVATDILPEAPYGVVTTRTFTATYPGLPTSSVQLVIDGDDVILECTEAQVACDPAAGLESWPLPGCTGACDVQAGLLASPTLVCVGQASTLDARGSSFSDCGSGALEYQLSDASGVVAAWQPSSVFAGIAPSLTTEYTVEARCQGAPSCTSTATVEVEVERPPTFDPLTVIAQDVSNCQLGVRVTWRPATFHGATGVGSYNVYRSTVSCADALASAPIAPNLPGTSFNDPDTASGVTYFYVVEAEDGSPATTCQPRGPNNNGTVTRVDASGGTCAGVTDVTQPDVTLLPRVGGSLRLGGSYATVPIIIRYGQDFVDLEWTTDVPIDLAGGEHFHVYRSEAPDAGFALVAHPPLVLNPLFTDLNAGDTVGNVGVHVWHYKVYVADACENDNSLVDNP